jgi:peptide/nickel transport system ATP-binding protein
MSNDTAAAAIAPDTGADSGKDLPVRLEVKDLQICLGDNGPDVVSEVSFSVRAGEVLGLVGESGSGKTTVALALLGHARRGLTITNGSILLDGTDVLSLGSKELEALRGARVAYVPQDPSASLNPTLRIGSQLKEALEVHPGMTDDPDQRVAEVMGEAHLDASPTMLRRYPHQLSGGQQQRVGLAMAFSCRPALIVLDEPTTGLDVTTQRHVLETVRTLCSSYGVAAVYVSHDLAVVGGLVANVAVMYSGRIIELGSTAKVFGFPVHPYSRGLLAAVPSPDRAEMLTGIEGQPPRPGRRPQGCSFAPRCSYVADECRSTAPPPQMVADRMVRCLRATEIEEKEQQQAAIVPRVATDGDATPVLRLRDVFAKYGHAPVLSDINFEVMPDSCLAVVGESGSGKTTLARCIVGLHQNWTGEMTFEGAGVAPGARKRPKEQLKRVQYIFQNPYTSLNPRKTIGQIISQPLELFFDLSFAERSEKIQQVLEDVSLGADFFNRYPDQLSGGERQRVAIARALVVEPDLLVCDEVTSALDVSVQAIIVELLRRLQTEHHLAMVFITHNLALVRSIAQDTVVLCEGRVVESGTVDEVLEHPKEAYTIRLMEDVPKLARAGTISAAAS